MTEKNPLWQDILKFSKHKSKLAIGFIGLGIAGLVLPVIPGFALLAVGLFILKPEWYERFKKKFSKNQQT